MVVHKFSNNIINSGIFKVFQASGFFATIIFFVLNSDIFTPIEMVLGVILTTVLFQGLSNLMLSFILKYFTFEEMNKEFQKRYNEENIKREFDKLEGKLDNKEEMNAQDSEEKNIEKSELKNEDEIEKANISLEEKPQNNDIINTQIQLQEDEKAS